MCTSYALAAPLTLEKYPCLTASITRAIRPPFLLKWCTRLSLLSVLYMGPAKSRSPFLCRKDDSVQLNWAILNALHLVCLFIPFNVLCKSKTISTALTLRPSGSIRVVLYTRSESKNEEGRSTEHEQRGLKRGWINRSVWPNCRLRIQS